MIVDGFSLSFSLFVLFYIYISLSLCIYMYVQGGPKVWLQLLYYLCHLGNHLLDID